MKTFTVLLFSCFVQEYIVAQPIFAFHHQPDKLFAKNHVKSKRSHYTLDSTFTITTYDTLGRTTSSVWLKDDGDTLSKSYQFYNAKGLLESELFVYVTADSLKRFPVGAYADSSMTTITKLAYNNADQVTEKSRYNLKGVRIYNAICSATPKKVAEKFYKQNDSTAYQEYETFFDEHDLAYKVIGYFGNDTSRKETVTYEFTNKFNDFKQLMWRRTIRRTNGPNKFIEREKFFSYNRNGLLTRVEDNNLSFRTIMKNTIDITYTYW